LAVEVRQLVPADCHAHVSHMVEGVTQNLIELLLQRITPVVRRLDGVEGALPAAEPSSASETTTDRYGPTHAPRWQCEPQAAPWPPGECRLGCGQGLALILTVATSRPYRVRDAARPDQCQRGYHDEDAQEAANASSSWSRPSPAHGHVAHSSAPVVTRSRATLPTIGIAVSNAHSGLSHSMADVRPRRARMADAIRSRPPVPEHGRGERAIPLLGRHRQGRQGGGEREPRKPALEMVTGWSRVGHKLPVTVHDQTKQAGMAEGDDHAKVLLRRHETDWAGFVGLPRMGVRLPPPART
jgi:hypothetical protein